MSLLQLAWKNILGSPFRSGLVFLCVALVASSSVGAALVAQGARESLQLSLSALQGSGADLIAIPGASGVNRTGGREIELDTLMENVTAVPGVTGVSPQLLVMTLEAMPFCAKPEMHVVAFDPMTDFVVLPRWSGQSNRAPGFGEALAGSLISTPPGSQTLNLAGYELELVGRLETTGGIQDQSLFVTFLTAQDMARRAQQQAGDEGVIAANNIPTLLIKASPGSQTDDVATRILEQIPNVSVFDGSHFFLEGREQMQSLLKSIPWLLGFTWAFSIVFIGLVFTVAVNERQREIGVLRALGSTRSFVLRCLVIEGFLLALGGGVAGAIVSTLASALFREKIIEAVNLPLASPSPIALVMLAMESLAVALLSTNLAILFPSWRVSRQDPAVTMKG